MPLVTEINTNEVHAEAVEKLRKEKFDKAVKFRLEQLRARKAHFFPKKCIFQWPVRFEEWIKPQNKAPWQ